MAYFSGRMMGRRYFGASYWGTGDGPLVTPLVIDPHYVASGKKRPLTATGGGRTFTARGSKGGRTAKK